METTPAPPSSAAAGGIGGGGTSAQQGQLQQTLADTPATAMAQAAATVAASPPVGALPPPPTLIDCILRDHSNTLTLFSYFFKATSLGDAAVQDMTASALALDLRLHSHAETVVLYPILQSRLGPSGAQWATRALAEHSMIEQSIADVLALRSVGGQALENRMKQMQTEIIAHLAEEESQILPTVAAALSQEEAVLLSSQWKAAKQMAPLAPQTPAVLAAQAAALGGDTTGTTGADTALGMDVGGGASSPTADEVDMGVAPSGGKAGTGERVPAFAQPEA